MKILKAALSLGLALLLCLCAAPTAWAAEAADGWDDTMAALLEEYEVSPERVWAGYMDLTTGEEHYLRGDEYSVAASMYKLPLCMLISERINSGELDWDAKYPKMPLDYIFSSVIVDSSNDSAGFLLDVLGGYNEFRRLAAEAYLNTDPDSESDSILFDNRFTCRQFISCLKVLYDRQEDFGLLLDCMKRAEPERFFNYNGQVPGLAQKYGFWQDEYYINIWMNDCGIVFSEHPIAIVMFTNKVSTEQRYDLDEELLAGYCAAMQDYAQSRSQQQEQVTEDTAAEVSETLAETPVISPVPTAAVKETDVQEEASMPILPCILILAAAAVCVALILINRKRKGLGAFWALVCVAVCAVALLLCVAAMNTGTVYAKPQGDPQQAVSEFFDALKAGDYTVAYARLLDYSSLGLEDEPSSEAGKIVAKALRQSYDYELLGDCAVDKLSGTQSVRMRYLDLTLLHDAVETGTMDELKSIVQSRPRKEVYDESDQYLPEVANEAYLLAVEKAVAQPEQFYNQAEFQLELSYSGGSWQIVSAPALLKALNGGAAY